MTVYTISFRTQLWMGSSEEEFMKVLDLIGDERPERTMQSIQECPGKTYCTRNANGEVISVMAFLSV